jgi:hypothetical protein
MYDFRRVGGSGSEIFDFRIDTSDSFKRQVRAINDNESLTDTEKMEAINLLLNPIVVDNDFGITFQGTEVSFQGTTINYTGVN